MSKIDKALALSLKRIEAAFDLKIAGLQTPETKRKIQAIMEARGKIRRRPRAGKNS
jgi:hypothetical protein